MAHQVIDDALGHVRDVPDRPVWRPMPADVRAALAGPAPREPRSAADLYHELQVNLMPYPVGNVHPRFWMWCMGSGSFTGALAATPPR